VRILVVIVLLSACRPLGPGETRCVTNAYGVTNCKTGQAPPPPATPGWWCSARSDGFGFCHRQPGECEAERSRVPEFAPCGFQQVAICVGPVGTRCYINPTSCSVMEQANGRDGRNCMAVQ
jgi:hypothetical protein